MTVSTVADCPPIAERDPRFSSLGAIDRIGDAFCQSAQDLQRVADVQDYRAFRMRCLGTTLAIVDDCRVPTCATVSIRLKRLDSIRRKIGRASTNFSLGRLDDVVGVRVICEDLAAVKEFSDRIVASPYFYRLKDYIKEPAVTGYRGINHIMRLEQSVTAAVRVTMRFEIQVRTYLQHRWAVWSESHGEAVKLGLGPDRDQDRLRAHSEVIAQWEAANTDTRQIELPKYLGGRSITVCWRMPYGPVTPYDFHDVREAVEWLHYLETTYQAERANALLLVGVIEPAATHKMLQLTHPLFTGARVLDPRHWLPTALS